jgi:hypothetical protein
MLACNGATNGSLCLQRLENGNHELLKRIAREVESELSVLGVPSHMFANVVLLPMCRLGSHASGSERGSPCSASFWSAQYLAGFFTYALVGPYHRVSSCICTFLVSLFGAT